MNKATDAVTNNGALAIAVGVLILGSIGITVFYSWITKVSKANRESLEQIIRDRVAEVTRPLEERIQHLENEVRTLQDGRKAATRFMAKAMNANDLESCKQLVSSAMEAFA